MASISARPASEADAPARVRLLETLLRCDDTLECAERTLAWLGQYAGVAQAICALADPTSGQLAGVAGHRVAELQVNKVLVPLSDLSHPFIQALDSQEPLFFRASSDGASGDRQRLPRLFGRAGYWAFPIAPSHSVDRPAGGLLLIVSGGEPTPEVAWAAGVLDEKLPRLRARQTLSEGEGQLRRERSRLHAIINAVADPLLLTDTEGRLVVANARAEALFSVGTAHSEGRRRAVELNNMFLSAALWRMSVGAADVAPQELLLVDPADGSDLLFELLGTVVHDPREGTGIVSVLRNVTDLRRATDELAENYRRMRLAEAQVRSERDRLDLIIDSVADPILVSDAAGKITLMNPPAERLFAAEAGDESTQRHVQSNDAHFSSFIGGLLSEGSDLRRRGEISLMVPATRTPLPVEAIAGKVLSEGGELIAIVTILHDHSEVLERARLYEQVKRASDALEAKVVAATAELARQNELLRRQAMELEQASALKSQFLANMSHEFRTPLNAILGYSNILLEGVSGTLNSGQKKSLERIASNARHLVGIVSEILDITRIEAGRMSLQLSRFGLQQLFAEVMAEMDPIIKRSALTVSCHVGRNLGPVRSDRQKIKQIVLNLLSNALKFTPRGSVSLRATPVGGQKYVAIAVTDTGIGVDPADREKIFEDFRQVDNTAARPYGGTGLGLSICRRLATMLGGRIELESEVGRGSTFTLVVSASLRK